MSDSQNFFTDPKKISLLALLVAFGSLIFTLINQREQNRRWDKLNEGVPEITEIRFLNWLEITKEQAFNIQWGYDPHIYSKGEASGIFVLPYHLVIRSTENNEKIKGSNPVFTLGEIQQELKRLNYQKNVSVYKLFRPKFEIENMGKTEIKIESIIIEARHPEKEEWYCAFTSNAEIKLAGSQKRTVHFDWELPISNPLPEQIIYKVYFKYINHNDKLIEKIIGIKWTSSDNFWSYETINE